MRKIRFSHNYVKLHGQKTARLLYVGNLELDTKDARYKDLIEYDTCIEGGGNYRIRKGSYVILLLLRDKGIPFTTIRSRIGRFGLNKEEYYEKHIGEVFSLVIDEDGKKNGEQWNRENQGDRPAACHS